MLLPTLCLLLSLLLLAGLVATLWLQRQERAGLPGALPPLNPQMTVPQRGVNVDLAQYSAQELPQALAQIREAGFHWVRQTLPWADIESQPGEFAWAPWDRIVDAVGEQELEIIAVLDTSPTWARRGQEGDAHTPPQEVADFGRFARAVAARYGDRIDYYQVWDEPNLSYHWGGGAVDAQDYTRLLREAAIQIRDADAVAWILTAGLAPTVETGPLNVNGPGYLEGIYAAGGAPYFDIVAAKCYGFQHDARDQRLEGGLLNFSRVLFVRQVMERRGDAVTPIWAVEFGWNHLPDDWAGRSPPWKSVGAEEQITYTLAALARAEEEWPWMGAMILTTWQPDAAAEDPIWGFALEDADGLPQALLQRLQREARSTSAVAHVGRYPPHHPTGHYAGGWQVTPEGADIGASGDRLTIPFQGTRLDLALRKGNYWALLYVAVDGKPSDTLPRTDDGRSYVVLYSPEPRTEEVVLARYLPEGEHTVEIVAEGGWGQWAVQGWSVYREADTRTIGALQTIFALGLLATVPLAAALLWPLPWPRWSAMAFEATDRIPPVLSQVLTLAGAAAFYFAPGLLLSLPGLGMLALCLFLAPSTGLPVVALAIPFYRQPKQITGRIFGMAEIVTLMIVAAWAARQLMDWLAQVRAKERSPWDLSVRSPFQGGLTPIDWGMGALGLVSLLSLFVAQEKRVALRELRTVVLEPLLFYSLLRATIRDRKRLWHVVDGWALSGLIIAIWGLAQFASGQGVITAEGVWRVKGPYGSPNNLALMLGRQIPLLISVAAFSRARWRRVAYALIGLPAAAAFYLTYSRAGWLAGLPVPLLFLGLMQGGRAMWGAIGALLLGGLSSIPVLSTERFRSLLSPYQGTLFFRLRLWQSSLAMLRDHPLLGVGLDNFLYQYRSRYILPSAWQEPDLSHPHNLLLEFWTRLGVMGVGVLAWVEIRFFRQAWRLYRGLPEGNRRALVLGAMAGMVNVLSHGLVDNGFFVIDLAYVFCLLVGLVAQMGELQN